MSFQNLFVYIHLEIRLVKRALLIVGARIIVLQGEVNRLDKEKERRNNHDTT